MNEIIVALAGAVMTYASGVGAILIHKYLPVVTLNRLKAEAELLAQEVASKEGVAYDAVRLVEDLYATQDGPAKLQSAIKWAVAKLAKDGIVVTPAEIEEYVRIAYQDFVAQLVPQVTPVPTPAPDPIAKFA